MAERLVLPRRVDRYIKKIVKLNPHKIKESDIEIVIRYKFPKLSDALVAKASRRYTIYFYR